MSQSHFNRIKWACRRGMLECDLFLGPFAEARYAHMISKDQVTFERLLALPDQTLYRYFMQLETPPDPDFAEIIKQIQQFQE